MNRTKYFAVVFDPAYTSDSYRYEMQEVFPLYEGEEQDLNNYSYSLCGKYKAWKPNCYIASRIRELTIEVWEVAATDELKLLDQIEDRLIHAADVALERSLDPIKARKFELAQLTYQAAKPESTTEPVMEDDDHFYSDNGSVEGEEWEPDPV